MNENNIEVNNQTSDANNLDNTNVMSGGPGNMDSNIVNQGFDVNENNQPTMQTPSSNISGGGNKNSSLFMIVAIFILLIALGGMGFYGYKLYQESNNPKKKFVTALNKLTAAANIENDSKFIKDIFSNGMTYKINGNIKASESEKEIINVDLDGNFVVNSPSKQVYYDILLKHEGTQIIDFEGLAKDNKLYIKLKDIFDKFYYTDYEFMEDKEIDSELYNKIYNVIDKSMNQYFTEDKFVKSEEEITYNNAQEKATKISLNVTTKDFNDLAKIVLTNLKNEDEILNNFVMDGVTLETIKTEIQNTIDEIDNATDIPTDPVFTYNVYFKGSDLLKQEMTISDGIVLTFEGSKEIKVSVKVDGLELITGTISNNTIELNVNYSGVVVKLVYKENTISNGYKGTINFNFSLDLYGSSVAAEANLNYEMTSDNTIPNVDISNAKAMEDITEAEQQSILEKLQKIPYLSDYFASASPTTDIYTY